MAKQTDIHRLTELWREQLVIRNQTGGIPFEDTQAWREAWSSILAEQLPLPDYAVFVAEDGDIITGFIAGHTQAKEGYIDAIALDAHRYYGGQGKLLYNTLREWFNQQTIDRILVSVPRYHAVEQAFWRALGATEWKNKTCPPLMMFMTL